MINGEWLMRNMNELIQQCRYYKGENECPKSIEEKGMATIWFYEQIWVEREELRDENGYNALGYFSDGLKDFNRNDGTPMTLKALLFNRYSHWSGGYENLAEGFKKWHERNYIGGENNG